MPSITCCLKAPRETEWDDPVALWTCYFHLFKSSLEMCLVCVLYCLGARIASRAIHAHDDKRDRFREMYELLYLKAFTLSTSEVNLSWY